MVLGVAAAMAMMLVAFVAPAMAETNELNDSERYGFVVSDDRDWNDHNDYSYYDDEYLEDLEDAYEDYVDEVEDYVEDYEGSYWGFNSYYW
jgi:hypothetical protein